MGRSRGPGTPLFFLCPVERRERADDRVSARYRGYAPKRDRHVVQRTGRTKRNPSTNRGVRMLGELHEYICSCGHTGWSGHVGVLRNPLIEKES